MKMAALLIVSMVVKSRMPRKPRSPPRCWPEDGVVLNEAFGVPTIAVDTHIFRVGNRTAWR